MKKAVFSLILTLLVNFAGMYFGFYDFWWFDVILHFLGGFFVAMLMTHYLADIVSPRTDPSISFRADGSKSRTIKTYLVIVGAVSFIGVVWEFAEYLASLTLIESFYNNFGVKTSFIGDLDDTINDLLMDIVGALAWLTVFRRK